MGVSFRACADLSITLHARALAAAAVRRCVVLSFRRRGSLACSLARSPRRRPPAARSARHRYFREDLCATRLQILWRGCIGRGEADRRWLDRRCRVIQAAARGLSGRRRFKILQARRSSPDIARRATHAQRTSFPPVEARHTQRTVTTRHGAHRAASNAAAGVSFCRSATHNSPRHAVAHTPRSVVAAADASLDRRRPTLASPRAGPAFGADRVVPRTGGVSDRRGSSSFRRARVSRTAGVTTPLPCLTTIPPPPLRTVVVAAPPSVFLFLFCFCSFTQAEAHAAAAIVSRCFRGYRARVARNEELYARETRDRDELLHLLAAEETFFDERVEVRRPVGADRLASRERADSRMGRGGLYERDLQVGLSPIENAAMIE